MREWVLAVALVGLGVGCTEDKAELHVTLRTDVAPGHEFTNVRTEVFSASADGTRTDVASASPSDDFLEGKPVASFEGLDPGAYTVATSLRDRAGAIVLDRTTRVTVKKITGVRVLITRDCRGFVCPGDGGSGDACYAEQCVDEGCSGESLDLCGEPECTADGDCESLVACSEARCLDGACYYGRRDDDCDDGEWCNVDVGCVPSDEPTDGGPGDAGGPDGGCAPGTEDCDDDARNGCETNILVEERNCGGCGIECDPGDLCNDGMCGPGPVVEITAGRAHACARDLGGGVRCWGDNLSGQLGDGTMTTSDTAVSVDLPPVASISAGDKHTCAVAMDGTLYCWGDNTFGQLGDGTMMPSPTPVVGGEGDGPFEDVGVGVDHSCAVRSSDGTGWCYGNNDQGQLGYGLAGTASEPPVSDFDISPAPITNMRAISSGFKRSAAVKRDDSLLTWGGGGHARGRSIPGGARTVSVGDRHTCLVYVDGGRVRCVGAGADGRLGNGDTANVSWGDGASFVIEESTEMELSGADDVAAGYPNGCAALGDAGAVCWGSGARGALGNGGTDDSLTAVPVTGLATVEEVAAGEQFACARQADGQVLCWGRNDSGQLGDGTRTDRPEPVAVLGVGD